MFKDLFCAPIFILANRIVTRCRSEKERRQLEKQFNKHFESVKINKTKAEKYEHIISQKDDLITAVKTVKEESASVKEENFELENELIDMQNEYKVLSEKYANSQYLLAMICNLHMQERWDELDEVIKMISKQYLPVE